MSAERTTRTAAAAAAAALGDGAHEYGWFGGRANDLDDQRSVAFAIERAVAEGDELCFRFNWRGAVVRGRLFGLLFTGSWRQSTGDGEVALEFAPGYGTADGWWTLPHEHARHRAFIRRRSEGSDA